MPWYNGNYPPSYKNQPVEIRDKAVEIANALLEEGVEEGVAIATGLKRAREHFQKVNAGKYDLQRFHKAQKESYSQALAEIKNQRKASHWMWYIFP